MRRRACPRGAVLLLGVLLATGTTARGLSARQPIPHPSGEGAAARLIVDGSPFLILGGELGNSSASSLEYLRPIWPKLEALHLNTVLAPVYRELLEPREGGFEFTLVDGLLRDARAHRMRLVLLWFGSWKNSMSSYAPAWVKRSTRSPCTSTRR